MTTKILVKAHGKPNYGTTNFFTKETFMANIYELTYSINLLWDLMDQGELDDDVLIDTMMNSQEDLKDKLEGYCMFIKQMESDINGIDTEIKRLQDRKAVLKNTIERSKKVMQMAMETAGEKKVKGQIFTISIQANPESVVLDESYIENIPPEYLRVKDPEIDKAKLKEDLKNGVNLEGIAHLEQNYVLRIR